MYIYKNALDYVTSGLVSLCCCRLLERQQLFLHIVEPLYSRHHWDQQFYNEVSYIFGRHGTA